MRLKLKLKVYALCSESGDLLLNPIADPLSSLSKALLEEMAAKAGYGWTVREIEPIEADAEVDDLPTLATKLTAYV